MTAAAVAPAAARTAPASPYRLTFARMLRSEWIKLVSLRSTWWSIGIVAVLTVGIAVLVATALSGQGAGAQVGIQAVVLPIQFTMLLAGILGAISVTGEYSTGMIRSTLTADPVRGSVLAAKSLVVAAFLFLTSLLTFLAASAAVTPILADEGGIAWGDPSQSILPILAASLSMSVFALLGVAAGFTLRAGAGAIAATIGVLFVLPLVFNMFGMAGPDWAWVVDLGQYLPMAAAQSAILPSDEWGLSEPVAYLTLGGWVVAGMLAAWAVLRSRDA